MITNKWLGSYEAELASVIPAILHKGYRRIIDVGCAEGWYVVGLAVRMPNTEFVAFDIDPISRGQCRKLVRLNACSARVRFAGECTHADMNTLAGAGTLLICDIEGFERMLLDPAKAPALMQTEVLVEVHEDGADSRDLNQLLRARFDATHRIQEIWPEDRQAWVRQNRPAVPATIDDGLLLAGVQEHRAPGNHWLWMTCR
ncbi:MAG: hypothetical protein IPK32_19525 [Verrucomicrobiaceae bacterium]|nr:hypothetical protein [Verrucomicrobiaceae bacterium]